MLPICEVLEVGLPGQPYTKSLQLQKSRLQDPEMTPSARMLREMREKGEGFFHFAQRMSKQHRHDFMQQQGSTEEHKLLSQEAVDSWRRQREIEASDTLSFDQFLEDYFGQQLNGESEGLTDHQSVSVS
jgi:glutamate--cysteine ligase